MTALRPVHAIDGAVYLTPRGYVSAEDLTIDEVVELAPRFRLRDARLLSTCGFAALCGMLGLEVVIRASGGIIGRLKRAA